MFADLSRSIKARIDAVIRSAILGTVMGFSGLVAAGFLLGALFIWIAGHLGGLYTCLIFAGIFIVISGIAAAIAAVQRRKAAERARRLQQQAQAAAFLNPAIIGTVLQLVRGAGGKSSIFLLLGALAAGFFLSKSQAPPDES